MSRAEDHEGDGDRELLDAWRGGNDEAGSRLLERHFPTLARFFRARASGAEADLIQRTMLGCVESRERVPDDLPFKAYLLGIARRVLFGHFRQLERGKTARADTNTPPESPSAGAADREERRVVLRALRRLPLDLQLTLELVYWEDLTAAEVARVLDTPVGTAKGRLRRAKEALRAAVVEVARTPAIELSTLGDLDGWARSLRWFMERTNTPRRS